jgi:hypothetical protein
MASTSTAKKIVPSAPAPRIHPEMVAAVRKKKKPVAKKPVAKKAAPKAAAPKSKRVKLLSIREANSVIDQTRIAFSVSAIGSVVGIVLGSAVPLTTFMIAHYEWKDWWSIYSLLVIGGLAFSAKTVFKWGKDAFRDAYKALGFILLIEGVMVFSDIRWINLLSLSILIGINAVSTGANLVLKPQTKPSYLN